MKGAVAAGHPLTAEAGARILAEGGNAVDACVAAGFTSWVTESPLSGPGGGAFMLVQLQGEGSARLLDFFVSVPGLGGQGAPAELESVRVDFDSETSQAFLVGPASCAAPGTAAGLEAAHRAFGSLPWRVLLEPAIELARGGHELTEAQGYLHRILDMILRHTDEGRRVYGHGDSGLAAGDRLVLSDLAGTLETLASEGAAAIYRGELGEALLSHSLETGGRLTRRDLEEYRVIRRRPVTAPFRGHQFVSNPPPSSGGVLTGYGLRLLDRLAGERPGSAEAIARLAEAMREQLRAREGSFTRDLYRGGLAGRLYADEAVDAAVERMREGVRPSAEAAGPGGTTHVSVVDGDGNAAALSSSIGSGSGMIVPGTGIHLNNMLGEADLLPAGAAARPGRRLTSMMGPSIVLRDGSPRLVVGSAGSARLRGAILQIVVNVVEHGLPVEEAIGRPRVHLDEPQLHCEGGHDEAALARLERLGYEIVRWQQRNLFFGGVSAVEVRADGSLAAAGDPRRGGHGVVVG